MGKPTIDEIKRVLLYVEDQCPSNVGLKDVRYCYDTECSKCWIQAIKEDK